MATTGRVTRLLDPFRALARQLAAAVYVYIAYGLVAQLLRAFPTLTFVAELLLTFLAGALLARLIEGPWWMSGLVGAIVLLFDLLLSLAAGGAVDGFARFLFDLSPLAVLVPLSGLAGSLVVKRILHRRSEENPPPAPPAEPLP